MTLKEVYNESLSKLQNPDVDEINIRIILCEVNGLKNMSDFYVHQNEDIKDLQAFYSIFARFLNGEPIQYILGKTEFLGLEFEVNRNVLIPRQETEEVVAFAIKKIKEEFGSKSIRLLDVCCGSGCMGISAAKSCNCSSLIFSDLSPAAIEVTKKNLSKHNLDAKTYVGNALKPAIYNEDKVDVVISNPPYIVNKAEVEKSVLEYEPHMALFCSDALEVYSSIFENLKKIKDGKMLAVFEIGYDLKDLLIDLLAKKLPEAKYEFIKDINGKERILSLTL